MNGRTKTDLRHPLQLDSLHPAGKFGGWGRFGVFRGVSGCPDGFWDASGRHGAWTKLGGCALCCTESTYIVAGSRHSAEAQTTSKGLYGGYATLRFAPG